MISRATHDGERGDCSLPFSTGQSGGARKGIVLIVVAIVVALVSLSALGLLVAMRSDNLMAHLQADQQQVHQVAASGIALVQELTVLSRAERHTWGGLSNNTALFRDNRVDMDVVGGRHGRFSVVSPRYFEDNPAPIYEFGVIDTSSKLSLETLLIWDQQYPGSARSALMNLPGMTEAVADSLLDWIDADDEPREFGAESEFYQGLEPPRSPANMVPPRLEELLAVRGVNAYQLLGKPDGMQRVVSAEQTGGLMSGMTDAMDSPAMPLGDQGLGAGGSSLSPLGSASAAYTLPPAPPWSHYLTVISGQRNVNFRGAAKIDVNHESLAELHGQLVAAMDREVADFVVALRQFGPAGSATGDAADDTGGGDPLPLDLSQPAEYTMLTPIELLDAAVSVPVPAQDGSEGNSVRTVPSPFRLRSRESLDRFVQFCDLVATEPAERIMGRVNVMNAPRPVLLGIPGLQPDQVDQILSARQEARGAADEPTRIHAAWLIAEDVLDRETMLVVEPWITTGGDVLEAQIVACYDSQSPWARCEIVVDGTTPGAPTVYYKDLRRLGRGFAWTDLVVPAELETTVPVGDSSSFSGRLMPANSPLEPF